MYLDLFNHNPILIISRPKLAGPGTHWGVCFPNGQVADIVSDVGVRILPNEDAFAAGRDVTIIRVIPGHRSAEIQTRLQMALQQPRPYHPTQWNCEMFANWLVGDAPESPQVNGWAILAVAAVAVYAFGS